MALTFCWYRAFLPLEIDPNEAWNAWNSQSVAHLYPNTEQLIINNYPPLYFYLLHAFYLLGFEEVYAGRLISIFASLVLGILVYRTARVLGAARPGAFVGAIWFLATLAGALTGYVGMNDPNLLALSVMCTGFLWFVSRLQKGKATGPAVLLMVAGGFIKHNMIALPASALIWLAFEIPSRALRAAGYGLAACALGLLACRAVYGKEFIEQLTMPREISIENLSLAITSLLPFAIAGPAVTVWLLSNLRCGLARRMVALLALTFVSGFVQRLGDGVDVNAYFEFLFALAVGAGLAFNKVQAFPLAGTMGSHRLRPLFAILLLLGVSISAQPEPYRWVFSAAFRAELAENIEAVETEVKRIQEIPGNVSCSVMLVCYWAGKPFVWDDFAMKQRVATGKWTEEELKRRVLASRIRFETIDDRTVW